VRPVAGGPSRLLPIPHKRQPRESEPSALPRPFTPTLKAQLYPSMHIHLGVTFTTPFPKLLVTGQKAGLRRNLILVLSGLPFTPVQLLGLRP
jgi:hypothetical protein